MATTSFPLLDSSWGCIAILPVRIYCAPRHFLCPFRWKGIPDVICELLRDLGITAIDEACDGDAAYALFQKNAYDVIVTDWHMPNRNGLDLLKAIRTSPERSDTPVLVLTGTVTTERVMEALDAGVNGFVAKPFVAPSLCHKVLALGATLPTKPSWV